MFLSDKLIKIGLNANPKNNLSQANQSIKILDVLIVAKNNGKNPLMLMNITKFVVRHLNKKGFSYYKLNTFWKEW